MEELWPGLREAIAELEPIKARIDALVGEDVDPGRSIVRFLRGIPADDEQKKDELKKFFQTPEGQRYNSYARKLLYDDLLGVERNRETIG